MAQGGGSKREKLETPPEILVWSPSEEEGPPLRKERQTTTSPDSEEALLVTARRSEKASMNTSTDKDETEVNHRHRLLGFLLIPSLVLSSVLVGLDWEGEEIGCDASGGNIEPGIIFFEGVGEYHLYTFNYDDLRHHGDKWFGQEDCELSDWNIHKAEKIDFYLHMDGSTQYHLYEVCNMAGNDACAVVNDGTTWIPLEQHITGAVTEYRGYVSFENNGLFGSGYFMVAVEPTVEISEFWVGINTGESLSTLIFSIALTPAALLIANKWEKTNNMPDVRAGVVASGKIFLKIALLLGLLLTCVVILFGW